MKIATTTGDLREYCTTDEERVKVLYDAGFRYIDLSFYVADAPGTCNYWGDDWEKHANALREYGDKLGVKFVQAHAPSTNPLLRDDTYEQAVAITKRSLEVCQILGIENNVYHCGWAQGVDREQYFALNREFIDRVMPTVEQTGVNLCIENSTKANMGDRYYFFTGEDMRDFLDRINHPLINACWDTGHANIEGHQYDDLMALGNRLHALHINDNMGRIDEHHLPYTGTLNLDEVINGLIDTDYQGYFTFEAGDTLRFADNWLHQRHLFGRDTRLQEPTLPIYRKFLELMYAVGEQALRAYDIYEA